MNRPLDVSLAQTLPSLAASSHVAMYSPSFISAAKMTKAVMVKYTPTSFQRKVAMATFASWTDSSWAQMTIPLASTANKYNF